MKLLVALAAAILCAAANAAELEPWQGGATPALELQDLNGRTHRLADYKGKVVLLNFWATWCEPCLREMPSMQRLRDALKGEPFEVLAVNLAEPRSRIDKFLERVPLAFPLLLDRDTATAKAWKARILPASYVIGRDGRIRYTHVGDLDWASEQVKAKIRPLLK